mgnify:FL=1
MNQRLKFVYAIIAHAVIGIPLFYLAKSGVNSWFLALIDTTVLFARIFWSATEPKRLKGEE